MFWAVFEDLTISLLNIFEMQFSLFFFIYQRRAVGKTFPTHDVLGIPKGCPL